MTTFNSTAPGGGTPSPTSQPQGSGSGPGPTHYCYSDVIPETLPGGIILWPDGLLGKTTCPPGYHAKPIVGGGGPLPGLSPPIPGGGTVPGIQPPGPIPGTGIGGGTIGLPSVDLSGIGGFLHNILKHLTDPAFWKGTGLILAGGLVLIAGFLMWSGIGQATIEGTGPAQAYRRAQSGGVQNVRAKAEAT